MHHFRRSLLIGVALSFFSLNVSADCVVLLHGLARTYKSMEPMQEALKEENYDVVNIDYPSREKKVEELAPQAVEKGVRECNEKLDRKKHESIHFVTHSMGGILIRYYLKDKEIKNLGRVVMLAPPNKGSQVVDNLKNVPGYYSLNGPAGNQLGTDQNSIPNQLGPVNFELGVIAGTESINLILSQFLPNPDDGKVSVENTRVEGMDDFIAVESSHPFIMENEESIHQTLYFLQLGKFDHKKL